MSSPTSLSSPRVCVCVCSPGRCVSQQHSDVSVLEFHLERTPLLTSPHPPELTGQSSPPLDFYKQRVSLSVCHAALLVPHRRSPECVCVHARACERVLGPKAESPSSSSDLVDPPAPTPPSQWPSTREEPGVTGEALGDLLCSHCCRHSDPTSVCLSVCLWSVSTAIPLTAYGPMAAAAAAAAVVRGGWS